MRRPELFNWGSNKDKAGIDNKELDVLYAIGHFIVVSEESNDDHVRSGGNDVSSRSGLCHDGNVTEYLDWDWLDVQGHGI